MNGRGFDGRRLITDQMAIRAGYRGWLHLDAKRLAQDVLWERCSLAAARREMRLALRRMLTPQGWHQEHAAALTAAIRRAARDYPGFPGALHDAMEMVREQFQEAHPWSAEWRAFADDVLDEGLAEADADLDAIRTMLEQVAARVRRHGAWKHEVLDAVVAAARQIDPPPPRRVVEMAAEPPRSASWRPAPAWQRVAPAVGERPHA